MAALIVVDPLLEFIDSKVNTYSSQQVRQALAVLRAIAQEVDCAILAIIHLNKRDSTDPLVRGEASAAFTQVFRGGPLLGHDPNDPDGMDGSRRVLAVSASNLAAVPPALSYGISMARVWGDDGEELITAQISYLGETTTSAQDLLKQMGDDERIRKWL